MELTKLSDDQLQEVIVSAQTEQRTRADRKRDAAIEQITQLAREVNIRVDIKGKRQSKPAKHLKAGERFQHPDDPAKVWIAGNGRPPNWLDRAKKIA